jgi:hypothetical protein
MKSILAPEMDVKPCGALNQKPNFKVELIVIHMALMGSL